MQTITPCEMLNAMIGLFTESNEVLMLESSIETTWLNQTLASDLIAEVEIKLEWLEIFTSRLEVIAQSSKDKKITFESRLREEDCKFEQSISKEIQQCLFSAYKRTVCANDIGPAYFAVLIRDAGTSSVIATALVDFRPFPDIEFATRMEAVTESRQRQHIARSLFIFIEAMVCFLITADPFIRLNMTGLNPRAATIKSYVDADAPMWHGEMLVKLGFEDTSSDWSDELEFSKDLPV